MAAGWCGRIGGSTMPCESCAVQFSVFKRKRACCECDRYYCSSCLRRGGGMCAPCRVLSTRPTRDTIASLKVRDLQCFLQRQNVSTRGCVEKEELVRLCESHINSTSYRRRSQRPGASPFSSFKGFTNNINDLITSAFDLRNSPPTQQQPPPPPTRGFSSSCFNSAHAHTSAPPPHEVPPRTSPPRLNPHRFNLRPRGEADIRVPLSDSSTSMSLSTSEDSARVDTADCFEIEDVDEAGWEFVNRPADPLPHDSSEILRSVRRGGGSRRRIGRLPTVGPPSRSSSESDLNLPVSTPPSPSLQDEGPLLPQAQSHAAFHSLHDITDTADMHHEPVPRGTRHMNVEQYKDSSELEELTVKQLKELLTRSRVPYRGCLEREDLLQRAKLLWKNHHQYKDDMENLPIEDSCKICMAAPLECVLLECGHIAACTACSKQLAECPICRQYVVRAVRFFRS